MFKSKVLVILKEFVITPGLKIALIHLCVLLPVKSLMLNNLKMFRTSTKNTGFTLILASIYYNLLI